MRSQIAHKRGVALKSAPTVPITDDVKIILSVVVYLVLVLALALVSVFTRKPQPGDGFDDDL